MANQDITGGDYVVDGDGNTARPGDADNDAGFKNRGSRKRTKTGCLTCRKRRIKCGEERPVCKNCVKSKRHCEGYNQRVVWKPQVIDFRHLQNGAATITFPAATLGMDFETNSSGLVYGIDPSHHSGMAGYPGPGPHNLMPRPPEHQPHMVHAGYAEPSNAAAYHPQWSQPHLVQDPNAHTQMVHQFQAAQYPQYAPVAPQHPGQPTHIPGQQPIYVQTYPEGSQMMPRSFAAPPAYSSAGPMSVPPTPALVVDQDWTSASSCGPSPSYAGFPQVQTIDGSIERSVSLDGSNHHPPMPHANAIENNWSARPSLPQDTLLTTYDTSNNTHGYPIDTPIQNLKPSIPSPSTLLQEAAVEYHDDDYYDVLSSDDNELSEPHWRDTYEAQDAKLAYIQKFGQLQIENNGHSGQQNGVLDSYRPETVANPLKNPATARVFSHFIHVTGPVITSQTRRAPINVDRRKLPFSKRGLWTHTIPLAALNDQGLLQAILALSSLQIAGLTGESTTPSYKHYAFALKRVHNVVGDRSKRTSIPVVAASLLLGIYELWCADHTKWTSHLAGAGQLLVETDYVGKQQQVMELKAEKASEQSMGYPTLRRARESGQPSERLAQKVKQYKDLEQLPDFDMRLLSAIAGRAINHLSTGRVMNDHDSAFRNDGDIDIPAFEIQKDLFWAFIRQDATGSLISGNPLLMPYDRWTDCPPRGPVSAPDGNTIGAHDYLFLLLGRVADFNVRDRKRKLHVMAMNDGRWRPQTEMLGQNRPSRPNYTGQSPDGGGSPSPQLPSFYGMAPTGPNSVMPSSYNIGNKILPPDSPEGVFSDLGAATEDALEEWTDLGQALDEIESLLYGIYQPIIPQDVAMDVTPFGSSLFYNSLDIACVWATVYTIRIFINRVHPHMPPHGQIANGIAAQQNKPFVDLIGRICGGVMAMKRDSTMTPEIGAALTDLNIAMFVAGVQLIDPLQRDWILKTLVTTEQSCAFGTARAIADGCQLSWHHAGKAGRGPPWELRHNSDTRNGRISGSVSSETSLSDHSEQATVTDRRFVQTTAVEQIHWATGIIRQG
ncbi:hypothetical protein K461DRAFT_322202 [Myriangium duriaei CBS 260.36]|uniref:Zn(2)-C6 fungal-type domain-containing protein n=1 Tax=Myriangium duriaei CBS 260.36 TaxID=1168546 RepID=A0A9P4MLV5_9PEZI|nr:hypothetical protein K461DRAFT_322202 [Myriangium duriaei CBS 260.36]